MSKNCPVCGQGEVQEETKLEEFAHGEVLIKAEITEGYCDSCGSLVQSPKLIRENLSAKQKAIEAHDARASL